MESEMPSERYPLSIKLLKIKIMCMVASASIMNTFGEELRYNGVRIKDRTNVWKYCDFRHSCLLHKKFLEGTVDNVFIYEVDVLK